MRGRRNNMAITSGGAVLVVLLLLLVLQFAAPKTFGWVEALTVMLSRPLYSLQQVEQPGQNEALLRQSALVHIQDSNELLQLRNENQELKRLLQIAEITDTAGMTAAIVGQQEILDSTVTVINRGQRDGLEVGMPVVVDNFVLLGIISHVGPTHAHVLSLHESTLQLSGKIHDLEGAVHGIVEGSAGLATHLELVPKDIEIRIGQSIVTSGLDIGIPQGLLIGLVERVENEPNNFFQSATIQFMANPREYSYVTVLTSS